MAVSKPPAQNTHHNPTRTPQPTRNQPATQGDARGRHRSWRHPRPPPPWTRRFSSSSRFVRVWEEDGARGRGGRRGGGEKGDWISLNPSMHSPLAETEAEQRVLGAEGAGARGALEAPPRLGRSLNTHHGFSSRVWYGRGWVECACGGMCVCMVWLVPLRPHFTDSTSSPRLASPLLSSGLDAKIKNMAWSHVHRYVSMRKGVGSGEGAAIRVYTLSSPPPRIC